MSIFCDDDLPAYGENNCGIDKVAAISAIAYIKRGQTTITDFENPTQWLAALAAGDAVISKGLSADLPDGSAVNIDNKRACGPPQKQVSVDYTATIVDPNVGKENDIFYTTINGKVYDAAYYYCEENQIRVITSVSVSARIPQSVGNSSDTQHYNVTHSFRKGNSDFGELLTAPAGIFE